jgi:hypothetical protein
VSKLRTRVRPPRTRSGPIALGTSEFLDHLLIPCKNSVKLLNVDLFLLLTVILSSEAQSQFTFSICFQSAFQFRQLSLFLTIHSCCVALSLLSRLARTGARHGARRELLRAVRVVAEKTV